MYVIMYKGLDYNDETYAIGGEDASVNKRGFATLKEARVELKEMLKKTLKSYGLADLGYECVPALEKMAELKGVNVVRYGNNNQYTDPFPTADNLDFPSFEDFFALCEDNGIDWLQYAPHLYDVIEVNL